MATAREVARERALNIRHRTASKELTDILVSMIDGDIDMVSPRVDADPPSGEDYILIVKNGVPYRMSWIDFIAYIRAAIIAPPTELAPPVNTIRPVISGTPTVGVLLTATAGAWSGDPTPVITRQWLANDVPIAGATSTTYTPLALDVGKALSIRETAVNSQGTETAVSDSTVPVVVPATADVTILVYDSMIDGAIVAMATPGTTLVSSPAGLAIKSTGEIYLSDRDAFFAAVPYVAQTSGLDYGFILDTADYYDLDALAENAVMWFDAADHRNIEIDETSGAVIEWGCKSDSDRLARNDAYPTKRPFYVADAGAGTRPGVSFEPIDNGVYGLMFESSPQFAGLQRLAFLSSTLMETRWDYKYDTNILSQGKKVWPRMDMATNLTVAKMIVMTIIANKATGIVTFRVNGIQVDTTTMPAPNSPVNDGASTTLDYNCIAFAVFYADNAGFSSVSQIFSNAVLGNAYLWKTAPFRGDLFEIFSLIEAVPTP